MVAKKVSIALAVISLASFLIGLFISFGFVIEFRITFQLDLVGFIRIISALAFFISGAFLWQGKNWARIVLLSLMGLHAILSLSGVYFFTFPLTVIPGPNSQIVSLKNSLLLGWLPFLGFLFFLTRPGASARLRRKGDT